MGTVAYLLYGPEGKKNRKKVGHWAEEMKEDISKKLKGAKNLTKNAYDNVVDDVSALYEKEKRATKAELAKLVREMKSRWSAKGAQAKSALKKGGSKKSSPSKSKSGTKRKTRSK